MSAFFGPQDEAVLSESFKYSGELDLLDKTQMGGLLDATECTGSN
jgi:hypothetical protein